MGLLFAEPRIYLIITAVLFAFVSLLLFYSERSFPFRLLLYSSRQRKYHWFNN